MAPKKPVVTARELQALLTRIGSASSGTKSTLFVRFQRDVQRSVPFDHQAKQKGRRQEPWERKLRIMSIDMGIKNLAFCDAEVSYPVVGNKPKQDFDAMMNVLRWKKIDLADSTRNLCASEDIKEEAKAAVDDVGPFSLSVLSRTAHRLITKEVLSVKPDVILIEKQRWRSGGSSAVQQWTVRVNTLEAMLWAILETLKQDRIFVGSPEDGNMRGSYHVYGVDPKRVGQYWLSQHACAWKERNGDSTALGMSAISADTKGSEDVGEMDETKAKKKISRSKAEKSAKIAVLRSWLADGIMSTEPSNPSSVPRIIFNIDPSAEPTRQALLPKAKVLRKRAVPKSSTSSETNNEIADLEQDMPVTEIKKLDDITDCFLQAAAWVAWESNRLHLLALSEGGTIDADASPSSSIDEGRILRMIKQAGGFQ